MHTCLAPHPLPLTSLCTLYTVLWSFHHLPPTPSLPTPNLYPPTTSLTTFLPLFRFSSFLPGFLVSFFLSCLFWQVLIPPSSLCYILFASKGLIFSSFFNVLDPPKKEEKKKKYSYSRKLYMHALIVSLVDGRWSLTFVVTSLFLVFFVSLLHSPCSPGLVSLCDVVYVSMSFRRVESVMNIVAYTRDGRRERTKIK